MVLVNSLYLAYTKSPWRYEKRYVTAHDLLHLPVTKEKITSARQAAGHAVHTSGMVDLLVEREAQSGYSGWKLISKKVTEPDGASWRVVVTSRGFTIPSYTCVFTIDKEGTEISEHWPDNYCSYNK